MQGTVKQKIQWLTEHGFTYEQVAQLIPLTSERVRQILNREGEGRQGSARANIRLDEIIRLREEMEELPGPYKIWLARDSPDSEDIHYVAAMNRAEAQGMYKKKYASPTGAHVVARVIGNGTYIGRIQGRNKW